MRVRSRTRGEPSFSPLRYGDSIVGLTAKWKPHDTYWFQSPSLWGQHCRTADLMTFGCPRVGFSPLRYGDSIVGGAASLPILHDDVFQSPSLWGQHCRPSWRAFAIMSSLFQSPSLWGQHCRAEVLGGVGSIYFVSVPFAMGTAL